MIRKEMTFFLELNLPVGVSEITTLNLKGINKYEPRELLSAFRIVSTCSFYIQ